MTSRELRILADKAATGTRAGILSQLGGEKVKVQRTNAQGMNGLEADYARLLDFQQRAGEIKWWGFNRVRLLLADGKKKAWFRIDFIVVMPDGETIFFETKGFMREAAQLRLKIAAALFPWRIVLVKRIKGDWVYQEYGK